MTTPAITAIEYARNAGVEFCRQILSDPINHQNGPGEFANSDDIPNGDYRDMTRRFGEVTVEMERAYKSGYNETAAT